MRIHLDNLHITLKKFNYLDLETKIYKKENHYLCLPKSFFFFSSLDKLFNILIYFIKPIMQSVISVQTEDITLSQGAKITDDEQGRV